MIFQFKQWFKNYSITLLISPDKAFYIKLYLLNPSQAFIIGKTFIGNDNQGSGFYSKGLSAPVAASGK